MNLIHAVLTPPRRVNKALEQANMRPAV